MQQGVERRGVDRRDRGGLAQQALADGVDGEAHGGLRGTLGVARLQHVQAAFLDRELGVLHVAVVALELAQDLDQLGMDRRHHIGELGQLLRVAHAGDDVLALGVDQEVARGLGRARDLIAAEGDAGPGGVALVAVDHLLHVDGGAPVVGDVVDAPVGDRAVAAPGVEHGEDRLAQLLDGLLRELLAGLLAEQMLVDLGQLAQRVDVEVGVERDAAPLLQRGDLGLDAIARHAAHDVREHLQEAPVGVPGEALVAGCAGEPAHGAVVEAQVEDRVHHPRHRLARPRAHRQKERVLVIAEAAPDVRFEALERLRDLGLELRAARRRRSCRRRRPRS